MSNHTGGTVPVPDPSVVRRELADTLDHLDVTDTTTAVADLTERLRAAHPGQLARLARETQRLAHSAAANLRELGDSAAAQHATRVARELTRIARRAGIPA